MRILVISPIFPPLADAEANCAGKFVRGLIDRGIDPLVVFSSNVRPQTRMDRSKIWQPTTRVSIDIPNRAGVPALRRCWLGLRYQSTAWVHWTHATVSKAMQLHGSTPFDLIVSRSLPERAHLAGYWVASALRIPWVAVVNDPWDFSPFVAIEEEKKGWTPTLNSRLWWCRVVARADRLCFPSDRLLNYCLRGSTRKAGLMILPHIGTASESQGRVDGFVIVHAGKLGVHELTGRSSIPLLEALSELFRIRPAAAGVARLVFVGPEDRETLEHVVSLKLTQHVACTGLVSYQESLDHIAQAAVCVLVEADIQEGVFLPSKLCDYVAARKPVLALSPEVGTVADLVAERGIRRVNPNDSAAAASVLAELFDAFVESRLGAFAPSDSLVRRFESGQVIDDFLAEVTPLTQVGTR